MSGEDKNSKFENITLKIERLPFVANNVEGEVLSFYFKGKEEKFIRGSYGLKYREIRNFMKYIKEKTGYAFSDPTVASFFWNTNRENGSETRVTSYYMYATVDLKDNLKIDEIKNYITEKGFKPNKENTFIISDKNTHYGYNKDDLALIFQISKEDPKLRENQVNLIIECGVIDF